MSEPAQTWAVVVGVGPGIGAAAAARLAKDGHRVLGIARRQESLDVVAAAVTTAGGTFAGALADAADASTLTDTIGDRDVRVLVYNAAVMQANRAGDVSAEELTDTLAVDVVGALAAVRAVRPSMTRAARGAVLITGGGLALAPNPDIATLSIGKAALRAFALVLGPDLAADGIRVATVTIGAPVAPGNPVTAELVADVLVDESHKPLDAPHERLLPEAG